METNEIIPWHFPMLPTEHRSEDGHEDGRSSLGGCGSSSSAVTTSASVVNESNGPPLCAGCHLRIVDKFFLSALDSKWHTSCLKCSECGMELESQISCYERDGLILCKQDYHRIYGSRQISDALHKSNSVRQCARCLANIASSELVMKAKCFLYHVECFKCVMCDVPLMKGDLFGMFEAVVYCQTHYQEQREQLFSQDFAIQNFYGCEADGGLPAHLVHPSSSLLSGGSGMGSSPWPPGTSPDSEYHTDTSISPTTKKKRGRRKRELSEDEASRGSCFPYIDPNTGLLEKTKRARTSFKHHQLRIMKSHFQMNQNPDSRELKELATKTGLDKKVLQVWFQNARAKWRRMNNSSSLTPTASSMMENSPTGMDHGCLSHYQPSSC